MRKRGRNLQLLEDGFNEEYFKRKAEISRQRADRWIAKTDEFEARHYRLVKALRIMLIFVPFPLVFVIIRGMLT